MSSSGRRGSSRRGFTSRVAVSTAQVPPGLFGFVFCNDKTVILALKSGSSLPANVHLSIGFSDRLPGASYCGRPLV